MKELVEILNSKFYSYENSILDEYEDAIIDYFTRLKDGIASIEKYSNGKVNISFGNDTICNITINDDKLVIKRDYLDISIKVLIYNDSFNNSDTIVFGWDERKDKEYDKLCIKDKEIYSLKDRSSFENNALRLKIEEYLKVTFKKLLNNR